MKQEEILNKLKALLSEMLNFSRDKTFINNLKLSMSTDIVKDLELDSLEVMDFICSCEEAFGIEIPQEDVHTITRLEDIVGYINEKVNA